MWTIEIKLLPGHTDQGTITGTWVDDDGTFTFSEAARINAAGQVEFITHAVTHRDEWKKKVLEQKAVVDCAKSTLLSLLNTADNLVMPPAPVISEEVMAEAAQEVVEEVDALPDTVVTDSPAEATVRQSLYEKVKAFLLGKAV